MLAFSEACGDYSRPAVAQGGVHILEVEVHVAVAGDEFRDGACGVAQGVVGFAESVEPVEIGVDFGELFVVDHKQGIHILAHLLGAVEGFHDFLLAFKKEGDGDDADGEQTAVAGYACHHGGCPGAGASAHSGGDEHHLGVVVEFACNVVGALLGCLAGQFGVIAGSQAFGGLGADEQTVWHGRVFQRLPVGVAYEKGNFFNSLLVHVVDGVVATAAHADHFDDYVAVAGNVLAVVDEIGVALYIVFIIFVHNCG